MRLVAKLTTALVVIILLGLTLQGILHLQRLRALHRVEINDDLGVLTRAVAAGAAGGWERDGEAGAARVIEAADAATAGTTLRFSTGASAPATDGRELSAFTPVMVQGQRVGWLGAHRPVATETAYLEGVMWSQAVSVAAVVVTCAALALLLGAWLVGRPVRRLTDLANRVASGDFRVSSTLTTRDELGRLERAMRQMARSLDVAWRQVRTSNRARARTLEQLRHADRLSTVGELSSGIAHQLGTPLNVVAGRAQLIEADPQASDRIVDHARRIARTAEHMTEIIEQLLAFSRRRPVERTRATPREMLEQTAHLAETLADERRVRIVLEEAPREPIEIEHGKVLQVLTNLATNAVQAMADGGVMTLGAERTVVDAPSEPRARRGAYLRMWVSDQGCGIPAEAVGHLFEPFFTTKRSGEGTGLGLSVSRGLVMEMGGWIEVESDPGRGSRFTVHVPLDEKGDAP